MEKTEMEEIYDKYANIVYRTAFSYLKNQSDAEDAVQDVFLKYFASDRSFDSEQHEKAWFTRVTINYCKDILKSFRVRNTVPLDEAGDIFDSPEEKTVYNAVMTLPKKFSLVIHLYYFEGYSTKEIAQMSGKSDQAIRTRLSRARKMLKKLLGEDFGI